MVFENSLWRSVITSSDFLFWMKREDSSLFEVALATAFIPVTGSYGTETPFFRFVS